MPEVRLIDANAAADKIMRGVETHADEIGIGGMAVMIAFARAMRDETDFPTIEAEPVVHCKDCVYYHKPHVQRTDGTECDISEVPEEYKPFPNMCNSDYGINVGGKCEYDNDYAPYEDDKTVFRQPEDFCSRGRRKE